MWRRHERRGAAAVCSSSVLASGPANRPCRGACSNPIRGCARSRPQKPPRPGEQEGQHYLFKQPPRVRGDAAEAGDMLNMPRCSANSPARQRAGRGAAVAARRAVRCRLAGRPADPHLTLREAVVSDFHPAALDRELEHRLRARGQDSARWSPTGWRPRATKSVTGRIRRCAGQRKSEAMRSGAGGDPRRRATARRRPAAGADGVATG